MSSTVSQRGVMAQLLLKMGAGGGFTGLLIGVHRGDRKHSKPYLWDGTEVEDTLVVQS